MKVRTWFIIRQLYTCPPQRIQIQKSMNDNNLKYDYYCILLKSIVEDFHSFRTSLPFSFSRDFHFLRCNFKPSTAILLL